MKELFYLNCCSSTNDEVVPLLEAQQKVPFAVYTFHQIKGRGQYGNSWENSKNENLAISFVFQKSDFQLSNNLLNYCTAIVLREFLAILTHEEIEIKWPNDLIIHEKKVAGILIETKKINGVEYYIIGIGVNVLQEDFKEIKNAASLLTQVEQRFELHDFTEKMNVFFRNNLVLFSQKENLMEEFNHYLFRKNKISVFEKDGVRQNGIILNADKSGHLLIDLENDGQQRFFYKEITLLY